MFTFYVFLKEQTTLAFNEAISAASFLRQVVPDMFCYFYIVKNHKNAIYSATTEAREKITTYLESLEFYKKFHVCLTKFKNYQILHNKISHRFIVASKLLSG